MSDTLRVNEIFGPTIQGEGASAGKPVVFLRLAGCNLACSWCDTPYTWNWKGSLFAHPDKFDPKDEMQFMTTDEVYDELVRIGSGVKALVISGGEPLLQQDKLIPLLGRLRMDNWHVEVETNGTVIPSSNFLRLITQINCSPKLSSSGIDNTLEKRFNSDALTVLSYFRYTHFKFVVTSDEDLKEILEMVKQFGMRSVYLMPEGRTKDEQEARQSQVAALCSQYNFKLSARLHILLWGTKRGV